MTASAPVGAAPRSRAPQSGLLLVLLCVLLTGQLVAAAPAVAHAELVSSTPADGQRLSRPPSTVVLRFTEAVGPVDGGFRLVNDSGAVVDTPAPAAAGSTVRWRMPADLPDGRYLVRWRVVSDDGHPLTGGFAFGVGVSAGRAPDTAATSTFSWPMLLVRLGGYLGFTLLTGVIVLAAACWPQARNHHRVQPLLRVGVVLAAVSSLLALLLQGPYAAGEPLTGLFDRALLSVTAHSSFGAWVQARLYLVLAVAALTWMRGSLESSFNRWTAAGLTAAVAVTFSGTGHAAVAGPVERAVDSAHALAAGVWVGGLVTLTMGALGRTERPGRGAWTRFSRLALGAVAVLLVTGTLNALLRLHAPADLWSTGYGRVLTVKVLLVAAALAGGALSRRSLHRGKTPEPTVRTEAALTLVVLALTAALGTLAPPPSPSSSGRHSSRGLSAPSTYPSGTAPTGGPVASPSPRREPGDSRSPS